MDLHSVEQSKSARRANLAQWRASRSHELSLPSGLVVEARDATIMDLVIDGNIPQSLMTLLVGEVSQNSGNVDLSKLDGTADFGKLINELVKICVIYPPIADVADDDHLSLDEIPGADKMFIFNWANREVDAARPFPDAGGEPLVAAHAS